MIKRDLLDRIPFFKGFSVEEKDAVSCLEGVQFLRFDDQETIIQEGDHDEAFFILLRGTAQVFKAPYPEAVAELKSGSLFGEIAFLHPRPRISSVISRGESIALRFNRSLLAHLPCPIREKFKDRLVAILIDHLDNLREVLKDRQTPGQKSADAFWDRPEPEAPGEAAKAEIDQVLRSLPQLPGETTKPAALASAPLASPAPATAPVSPAAPAAPAEPAPPPPPPPEALPKGSAERVIQPKVGEEVHQVIFHNPEDGFKIIYKGRLKAILENQERQKLVDMVALTEQLPKNFKQAIEKLGRDSSEYLYGAEYVIPKAARKIWENAILAGQAQLREEERHRNRYQGIDVLYM
ncbi:MAG: cyclic nucleotide-binding domain-containing protein [Magnetococcales bacterium]|nr:cyclic nucleotide-binding domain-containing protein [Magnetococcales bacterium]